ncbi:MAG: hypothetical protein HRU09_05285 [Oligoflexales bacterium]|nr:hypothetical protein [Oligoflexales bacterium]
MPKDPRTRVTFGSEAIRIQETDKDRESRSNYFLGSRTPLMVLDRQSVYGNLYLMYAPDNQAKSRSVDIRQSFLGIFPAISYSFTHLFRYNLTIGSGLWRSTTNSSIQTETEERSVNVGCVFQKISLDYAFNSWIETAIHSSLYYRYERSLLDWSYGISLNINLR